MENKVLGQSEGLNKSRMHHVHEAEKLTSLIYQYFPNLLIPQRVSCRY